MTCPWCDGTLSLECNWDIVDNDAYRDKGRMVIEVALVCNGDTDDPKCSYEAFTFLVPDESPKLVIWEDGK
jgi:hypothetical protein